MNQWEEGDRRAYIEDQLLGLTRYWFDVILLVGAALYLIFAVVDYFAARAQFNEFLKLRLIVSSSLLLMFYLNRTTKGALLRGPLRYPLIFVPPVIASLGIELMVLRLGGHASHYYAGLSLVVISVIGFIPMGVLPSAACALIVYLIYLVPILEFDLITNMPIFLSNNAFLIATCILALSFRALNQHNLRRTLELQFELDSDKKTLEQYSGGLERLVNERTRELNRSELLYRSLFEYANDGIITMGPDGGILNVNRKGCEMYGYEKSELVGRGIGMLEPDTEPSTLAGRLRAVAEGGSLLYEARHARKDGTRIDVEISARAVSVEDRLLIQAFVRDVTEKKRLQSQLMHAQKLDSIGKLAGGISHDFNNVLTSILGSCEMILGEESLDEYSLGAARNIEGAARSGVTMVSKLLDFARRGGSHERVPFDLNVVVEDTLRIAAGLIKKDTVRLRTEIVPGLPPVEGDPGQIEQVLMNLIVNAIDAKPGEIRISTGAVEMSPEALGVGASGEPGMFVALTVADNGEGISAEHMEHIFEPFYSTKNKGNGTGLGLAMAYGIIKEHGGYIKAESDGRTGTAFRIYLPARV